MESDDLWSRSVLTPSPSFDSPSDLDDDDEGSTNANDSAFVPLGRTRELVADLDLSRRDDRAVVKDNPFTKASAQASRSNANSALKKNNRRMGSSIPTAEDAGTTSEERSMRARMLEVTPWKPITGWTDGRGDPLPSSAPSGKKRTTLSPARPSKTNDQPTNKPPRKKAKKTTEAGIVFKRLRETPCSVRSDPQHLVSLLLRTFLLSKVSSDKSYCQRSQRAIRHRLQLRTRTKGRSG